jgi:hypothetical protein
LIGFKGFFFLSFDFPAFLCAKKVANPTVRFPQKPNAGLRRQCLGAGSLKAIAPRILQNSVEGQRFLIGEAWNACSAMTVQSIQ